MHEHKVAGLFLWSCSSRIFPNYFVELHHSYNKIEEMKEAVTKIIDTLTQEDFHGPSRSCWTVQQVHCSRRRLLRRGLEFHVCTINKSAHTKKVWKPILVYIYIYIYNLKKQNIQRLFTVYKSCQSFSLYKNLRGNVIVFLALELFHFSLSLSLSLSLSFHIYIYIYIRES